MITANKILKHFEEGLQMEDQSEGQDIDLNRVILDILKYLANKESGGDADPMIPQSYNLWKEISMETDFNFAIPKIDLPKLRIILERHKILGDEKDGM